MNQQFFAAPVGCAALGCAGRRPASSRAFGGALGAPRPAGGGAVKHRRPIDFDVATGSTFAVKVK